MIVMDMEIIVCYFDLGIAEIIEGKTLFCSFGYPQSTESYRYNFNLLIDWKLIRWITSTSLVIPTGFFTLLPLVLV